MDKHPFDWTLSDLWRHVIVDPALWLVSTPIIEVAMWVVGVPMAVFAVIAVWVIVETEIEERRRAR